MIGFIGIFVTNSLNHTYYSTITDLHNILFTVARALGFSVFSSYLLATDLNTGTVPVSMKNTLQILHAKSSLHNCILATIS
jgi:hypothetical protein